MKRTLMSKEEIKRFRIISQVLGKSITQKRAAELLNLSISRVKVLCSKVREEGEKAVVHGNVGRKPSHTIEEKLKLEINNLYRLKYSEFNFSHFQEKLAEKHNIFVSKATVYRVLTNNCIKSPKKHRKKKRHHRRAPREREGELVQIDASEHRWFKRGPKVHLHGAIDDATGKVLALSFGEQETTETYFELIRQMNKKGQLPLALYSDKRGVFINNNRKEEDLSIEEQLAGVEAKQTQFGRAMSQLGVKIILAGSPQAKGRVERLWGTLQDRLINDMALEGINNIDRANEFLPTFIKEHNRNFQRKATVEQKAYLEKVTNTDLKYILCSHHLRKLDRGMSFRYKGRYFVLPYKQNNTLLKAYASQSITVLESPKFGIKASLVVEGKEVIVTPNEIAKRELHVKKEEVKKPITAEQRSEWGKIGAANSPWGNFNSYFKSER